jgi:hypothetical protein
MWQFRPARNLHTRPKLSPRDYAETAAALVYLLYGSPVIIALGYLALAGRFPS